MRLLALFSIASVCSVGLIVCFRGHVLVPLTGGVVNTNLEELVPYVLQNEETGKVVNVHASSMRLEANIQQYDNPEHASSQWIFHMVGEATCTIKNVHSNLYLNLIDNTRHEYGNVQQYNNPFEPSSQWELHFHGNGVYSIMNVNSLMFLSVEGNSKNNEANIHQTSNPMTPASRWRIIPVAVALGSTPESGEVEKRQVIDSSPGVPNSSAGEDRHLVEPLDSQILEQEKDIEEAPETPVVTEVPEAPEAPTLEVVESQMVGQEEDINEVPETPEVPEAPEAPTLEVVASQMVGQEENIKEVPETPEVPEAPEAPIVEVVESQKVGQEEDIREAPEASKVAEVPEAPEAPTTTIDVVEEAPEAPAPRKLFGSVGIFYDNDQRNFDGHSSCPCIYPRKIDAAHTPRPATPGDYLRYLDMLTRDAADYGHFLLANGGPDYVDLSSGLTQAHADEMIGLMATKQIDLILLDWDRTITMKEGLITVGGNLETQLFALRRMHPGLSLGIEPSDVAEYILGGPERIRMLRNLFWAAHDHGVRIEIVTENEATRFMKDILRVTDIAPQGEVRVHSFGHGSFRNKYEILSAKYPSVCGQSQIECHKLEFSS